MSTEHTIRPLVISMTDFAGFKRCRKKFQIENVLQRNVPSTRETVNKGSKIHEILADIARCKMTAAQIVEKYGGPRDNELNVVGAYLRERPLRGETALVEEPFYTLVLPENDPQLRGALPLGASDEFPPPTPGGDRRWTSPAVYIRTTFDRVSREDDWILGIDYKSFEKAPSFADDDEAFQFRIYLVTLMKGFKTDRAMFLPEYIRQSPPGSPKGVWDIEEDGEFYSVTATGKRTRKDKWMTSECYFQPPEIVLSQAQADNEWSDLQDTARDIIENIYIKHRWYRTELMSGPHSCDSCFVKALCRTERQVGTLSAQDLDQMSVPRDDGERMSVSGMLKDPRVGWEAMRLGGTAEEAMRLGGTAEEPIRLVYGEAAAKRFMLEGVAA